MKNSEMEHMINEYCPNKRNSELRELMEDAPEQSKQDFQRLIQKIETM